MTEPADGRESDDDHPTHDEHEREARWQVQRLGHAREAVRPAIGEPAEDGLVERLDPIRRTQCDVDRDAHQQDDEEHHCPSEPSRFLREWRRRARRPPVDLGERHPGLSGRRGSFHGNAHRRERSSGRTVNARSPHRAPPRTVRVPHPGGRATWSRTGTRAIRRWPRWSRTAQWCGPPRSRRTSRRPPERS